MKHRTFKVGAAATAFLLVAAVGTQWMQPSASVLNETRELAFPELREQMAEVSMIRIEGAKGPFTLKRTNDVWTSPDRDNYRADRSDVNELLVQLSNMRLDSPKTSKTERYERLQLEDVGPDARSRSIRLEDSSGEILADAIIGRQVFKKTGDAQRGTYIRRAGEEQTWLATGGVSVNEQLTNWLDFDLVSIARADVKSIRVKPVEGEPFSVKREKSEDEFRLDGLALGQTVKGDADFKPFAAALANLSLEDVKLAAELAFPMKSHVVAFESFDGVVTSLRLAKIDDDHWTIIDAGLASEINTDARAEAQKSVEDLNTKTTKWAFKVSKSTYDRLTPAIEDWLDQDGTS